MARAMAVAVLVVAAGAVIGPVPANAGTTSQTAPRQTGTALATIRIPAPAVPEARKIPIDKR